ncbi:hypothetical protein OH76DRAFT_1512135 [Lentinus brumalis]|uniref:Uncharacterized protein n=1 Tax=Lentinus brumalis TaxID=2498619 RepID=A0A371DD15_9APHY|nr:hypothetical protein OH76DRAFT_1512135 [Polyporus brumalis]
MVLEASMQFAPRGRAFSRTIESARRSRERSRPEPNRPKYGWAASSPKYGWAACSKSYKSTLRPEVQQNADYLREYRIDVAAAKADLLGSTIGPEFPESEWSNLRLGKQVDLDVLLTSHYSSKLDEKHVQRVGDVELHYGGREASRKVTS